jgi:hypothetical protein
LNPKIKSGGKTNGRRYKDENLRRDDSYIGIMRRKRRKNMMIVIQVAALMAIGIAYASVSAFSPAGLTHRFGVLVLHHHANLTIAVDGVNMAVPAYIGLLPEMTDSHKLDMYGDAPGEYPLHTHDDSGIIHIESTVVRDYTLGDFFDVWGLKLTDKCLGDMCNNGSKTLKMFVNGQPSTDFRNLKLMDRQKISLVYG